VTKEDLLGTSSYGEIHDELEVVEPRLTLADGAIVSSGLNVRDLDSTVNITLPDDPAYATVGGFVMAQIGFIPAADKALGMACNAFLYGNGWRRVAR